MTKTDVLQAEYSLLFLLFSKERNAAIREMKTREIQPEFFAVPFHRDIYSEILKIYQEDGNKTLSMGTFKIHFLNRPGAHSDDELSFTQMLTEIKKAKVTMGDIEHLMTMLIEAYVTRRTVEQVADIIQNPSKISIGARLEEFDKNKRKLLDLLDRKSERHVMGLKDGLEARIARATEVKNNPDAAGMVCTGYKNLDRWIGKQSPGQFVIIQARTSGGKSMSLMGAAIANFKRGLKVVIITIEMSAEDYLYRFDSNLTGIEYREFATGDVTTEEDKIKRWREKINKIGIPGSDIMVYWVPSNCTPDKVDSILANNEFKPDLVIVDYAGDMKAGLRGIPDYSAAAHGEIYSRLKEMAGKYECVVYTAQQAKRGTGGKLDTESGSWSDVASSKADIMLTLSVSKEDEDFLTEVDGNMVVGRITVSVVKGRNIPKCRTHIIPRFHKMTWLERESEEMLHAGIGTEYKTDKTERKEQVEEIEEKMEGGVVNLLVE